MSTRKSDKPPIPMRISNGRYLKAMDLVRQYAHAKNLTYREVMLEIVYGSSVGRWAWANDLVGSPLEDEMEPPKD